MTMAIALSEQSVVHFHRSTMLTMPVPLAVVPVAIVPLTMSKVRIAYTMSVLNTVPRLQPARLGHVVGF